MRAPASDRWKSFSVEELNFLAEAFRHAGQGGSQPESGMDELWDELWNELQRRESGNPDIHLFQPDGTLFTIYDVQGKPMVTVGRDRMLTFGENYDPDEAARCFWDAFARHAHEPVAP